MASEASPTGPTRRQVEDRLEIAETRWLAADDAFSLMRRLALAGKATDQELEDAGARRVSAQHEVENEYGAFARLTESELAASLAALGDANVRYRVALKVACGHSGGTDHRCDRVCGRVVVARGVWLWVACGGVSAIAVEALDGVGGSCSNHGLRQLAAAVLDSAIDVARRSPRRWPLTRSASDPP
jgi:hypothetical protein